VRLAEVTAADAGVKQRLSWVVALVSVPDLVAPVGPSRGGDVENAPASGNVAAFYDAHTAQFLMAVQQSS
jgi:hypothetical protein